MLAPERARLRVKGRSGTKPGSILKRQIPIRTFAEWDEALPGFCEIDLVAHDGGDGFGEFCQTLDLTCVATGWTECRAVKNKAQRWCFEALLDIQATLPFPLLGLDSDNRSEFINDQLYRYCTDTAPSEASRSPGHGPTERTTTASSSQKNWPVVRQNVGYARYDTPAELEVLNELYALLRLYRELLPAPDEARLQDQAGSQGNQALRPARTPQPTRRRLASHRAGGHVSGPAARDQPDQARSEKGGEAPRSPLRREEVLLDGDFEDIFGEATDGSFQGHLDVRN
jgi:hypothetical protein